MTHRILYQPLFGVTLVGAVVCCAVTNALDQAPRRKPQVVHFSQSEPSDAQENEVARENEIVNVSAAAPQRSRERLEGEPSHVVPATVEIEIPYINPARASKVRVIQFGQSSRNGVRRAAEEPRPVVDSVLLQAQQTSAKNQWRSRDSTVVDSVLLQAQQTSAKNQWRSRDSTVVDSVLLQAQQKGAANVQRRPARMPDPTEETGTTPIDPLPSGPDLTPISEQLSDRGPDQAEETRSGQSGVILYRPGVEQTPNRTEEAEAARPALNEPTVSQFPSIAPPLRIDPSVVLLAALFGGSVLLVVVLFFALIFTQKAFGRQHEAVVKIDITNHGCSPETLRITPSFTQPVAPAHLQPAAQSHSQPIVHPYSLASSAYSQPAVQADSHSVVPIPAPQFTPVFDSKKERNEELQQQEQAVVRQIFEQNIELREKIISKKNRAA